MTNRAAGEYALFLETTSWYAHAGEDNAKEFAYLAFGLAGESGEFVDALKKVVRESGFDNDKGFDQLLALGAQDRLRDELGDVLWYVTRLCSLLGINHEQLMLMNTYKLFNRINQGDWAPPMEITWPFTDPMKSFDNVQMNLFPYDMPEHGEEI